MLKQVLLHGLGLSVKVASAVRSCDKRLMLAVDKYLGTSD